jgi:hypothetical protein
MAHTWQGYSVVKYRVSSDFCPKLYSYKAGGGESVIYGGGVWGGLLYCDRVVQQFCFTNRKITNRCTCTCGTLSVHVSLSVKLYTLLNHRVTIRVCPPLFCVTFTCISHCSCRAVKSDQMQKCFHLCKFYLLHTQKRFHRRQLPIHLGPLPIST